MPGRARHQDHAVYPLVVGGVAIALILGIAAVTAQPIPHLTWATKLAAFDAHIGDQCFSTEHSLRID